MQSLSAIQRNTRKHLLNGVSRVAPASTQVKGFATVSLKPSSLGKATNKSVSRLKHQAPKMTQPNPPSKPSDFEGGGLIPNLSRDALPNPITATKVTPLKLPESGIFPFGMLGQIPQAPSADDLARICISRAKALKVAKYITGDKEKNRDLGMRKLNVFTEYTLYRLDKCIHSIPHNAAYLHPFERTVVGLTLGPHNSKPAHKRTQNDDDSDDDALPTPSSGEYSPKQVDAELVFGGHTVSGEKHLEKVMADTVRLRNKIQSCYEEHSNKMKRCRSLIEVQETMATATNALVYCITDKFAVQTLRELNKTFTCLRQLNVVNPKLPTIALVGAPNVGKSSLVRVLSSGKPEVQNYPFTTKSITVGHLTVDGPDHPYLCQVTDTPGLLNRPDDERKKMEMLTLSVLEHIPRLLVVFVIDPSGHCGTTLEDQLLIRQELRWRYHKLIPGHRWIDVATKTDIWRKSPEEVAEDERRAEAELEIEMMKMQARRLGMSLDEVLTEVKAVDLIADHNAQVSAKWRDDYLKGLELLDKHGDWVVDTDEGVIKNGNGDVVMTIEEYRQQQELEKNNPSQVTNCNAALASIDELTPSSAVDVDSPEVSQEYEESDDEYIDTTEVQNDKIAKRKYHKPTVTATPTAPSSYSVGHTWTLKDAIASLPPRPSFFVDDNCHCCEISVASEEAYVEITEAQKKHQEETLKKMFGIVDQSDIDKERASKGPSRGEQIRQANELRASLAMDELTENDLTDSPMVDSAAVEEAEDIPNALNYDQDEEVEVQDSSSRSFAARDHVKYVRPVVDDIIGLGLHEVKVDLKNAVKEVNDIIANGHPIELMNETQVSVNSGPSEALLHGQAGLEDLQACLAWGLLELCEGLEDDLNVK